MIHLVFAHIFGTTFSLSITQSTLVIYTKYFSTTHAQSAYDGIKFILQAVTKKKSKSVQLREQNTSIIVQ